MMMDVAASTADAAAGWFHVVDWDATTAATTTAAAEALVACRLSSA